MVLNHKRLDPIKVSAKFLIIILLFLVGCGNQVADTPPTQTFDHVAINTEGVPATSTLAPPSTPTPSSVPTETPLPTPTLIGGGGGKIVFQSYRGGTRDIWMMDVDGGNQQMIIDLPTDVREDSWPRFSDDKEQVAVLSGSENSQSLWVGELTSPSLTKIAEDLGKVRDLKWSPDGESVFFSSNREGTFSLWMIERDGSNLVQITDETIKEVIWTGSFSPDGEFLAFTTGSAWDGNGDLWLLKISSLVLMRLTENEVTITNPAWSLDGQYIYYSSNKAGYRNIWRIKPDGSGNEQITNDDLGDVWGVSFFPEGEKILINANRDVWVMDLNGENLVQLTTSKAEDGGGIVSPDGEHVLFFSDRTGTLDIWRVNIDGTNLVQLTNSQFPSVGGVWSPDGTMILYRSSQNKNYDISIMDSDGSNQKQLTSDLADDYILFWLPYIEN